MRPILECQRLTKKYGSFFDHGCIVCYKTPACPLGIDEPAAFQLGQCFLHRVRIYGGFNSKIAYGGELIPGLIDTGNDVVLNAFHQLEIDGTVIIQIPWHSITSYSYFCGNCQRQFPAERGISPALQLYY